MTPNNEQALEQIKAARLPDCDWILDLEELIHAHGIRIRRSDFIRTTGERHKSGAQPASKAKDRKRWEAQTQRWKRWRRRCQARRLGRPCAHSPEIFVLCKRSVFELVAAFWIKHTSAP